MKIIENPTTLTVQEISDMASAEGVNSNRLDGAVSASFLPASGSFTGFGFDGYKEGDVLGDGTVATQTTKHLRMITESGDSISLSRLQISGFEGAPDMENDVLESAKGKFYLRSNCTPNPQLSGNQAAIVKKLIGKKFTAAPIKLIRTKYVEGGFSSKDEVKTVTADCYKVTLLK
jgi:hypothetical protein